MDKIFVPITIISRLLLIGICLALLEPILPNNWFCAVVYIFIIVGVIVFHAMSIDQFYHVIQTYLYITINLGVKISFSEAKYFFLLFAPTEYGKWYPMTGIKDLPKSVRREVLFESAKKIYSDLGYSTTFFKTNNNHTQTDKTNESLIHGFNDLVSMLCKLAKADNVISQEELIIIDDFFINIINLSPENRKAAINVFNQAKSTDIPFEFFTRNFYQIHKTNKTLLESVVVVLARIAFADGELSAEEEILINEAIAIFDVSRAKYEEVRSSFYASSYKRSDTENFYAKILGINDEITIDKVKSAYRKLVFKYHPDRLSHLGDEMRKVAEEKMKIINDAYAYFKKKLII
jgi:DnaJ like chaperone protein